MTSFILQIDNENVLVQAHLQGEDGYNPEVVNEVCRYYLDSCDSVVEIKDQNCSLDHNDFFTFEIVDEQIICVDYNRISPRCFSKNALLIGTVKNGRGKVEKIIHVKYNIYVYDDDLQEKQVVPAVADKILDFYKNDYYKHDSFQCNFENFIPSNEYSRLLLESVDTFNIRYNIDNIEIANFKRDLATTTTPHRRMAPRPIILPSKHQQP